MSKGAAAGGKAERAYAGIIKLIVPAGKAAPAPPVGPALGQKGLNLMEFCKSFNDKTKVYFDNTPIQVQITAFTDRTFTYKTKNPSVVHMLKTCSGVPKLTALPGKEWVGEISIRAIYEIALVKQEDMPHVPIKGCVSQIMATANNIGLRIVR
eukprot:CAMPEP_0173392538 /NCGR_PEP_ID=MMETSP1356-20130122/20007_1 /TAXON_ID=77927 ORGANISM="Hemiselmis virescens, Strain PCC157" /NCGR_SAMPLE_ID=MMETSP1356 /ASSEMBLY_ACC=CAM_ASM_000847 /LENGTH=152 /DNA_ID=CAMNT_0014350353 /DNA_START=173 /DNA_END=631 /DNA_ORIENTATION=-